MIFPASLLHELKNSRNIFRACSVQGSLRSKECTITRNTVPMGTDRGNLCRFSVGTFEWMLAVERSDVWSHYGFEVIVAVWHGSELDCSEPGDWGRRGTCLRIWTRTKHILAVDFREFRGFWEKVNPRVCLIREEEEAGVRGRSTDIYAAPDLILNAEWLTSAEAATLSDKDQVVIGMSETLLLLVVRFQRAPQNNVYDLCPNFVTLLKQPLDVWMTNEQQ